MNAAAAVAASVRAYAGQARGVRFHVAARARTCPFVEVEERVPRQGRVLDFGCGHGVLALALAMAAPDRQVTGVDIDGDKVACGARAGTAARIENVRLRAVTPAWEPGEPWDAIVVADVLYLLGREPAAKILRRLADAVAPGGVLLVKEIDVHPRWKYQLARVQELVATRVARITEGRGVQFLPPPAIGDTMAERGLAVEHVPLHRRRLHPHHLVIGRRAAP